MKYLWKRATGLLLTSALVLGLAACGGTPTGNTNPPEDPGTQQTTQPVAPDSGAAGEKLVYSNGGPDDVVVVIQLMHKLPFFYNYKCFVFYTLYILLLTLLKISLFKPRRHRLL